MADQDDSNRGRYLGYGLETCAGVLVGFVIGRWLDRKYQWAPWGMVVGSILGLAAGMYALIKDAIRMNKQ